MAVFPTENGTKVTVGEGAEIGSIYTIPATEDYAGMKYDEFVISGKLTTAVYAENPLNTQNAHYVEINGDLSRVAVAVNATAAGTEVKIGEGAKVKSLGTNKTEDTTDYFEYFMIDGKIVRLFGDSAFLDTMGAKTVTIGSKATNTTTNVPALKTTGAKTVTIGKGATVDSLDPDTATTITINGTISNNALRSNQIDTFILGAEGKIAKGTGTNDVLYLIPESGKKVKLLGRLDGINYVQVGDLTDSLVTKATAVATHYDVFKVPAVDMTLGATTGNASVDFHGCNGTVSITAGNGVTTLPSISFSESSEASVTLASNAADALASTIQNVKNITLEKGTFTDLTLKASEKIEIHGEAEHMNTFNGNLSLTAKTIDINQYTVFGGTAEKNVTINATGNVTIGGDDNQIDMNNKQKLVMKNATTFTMTNVKVGKIENYKAMTLKNCEITNAANIGDGLLAFKWTTYGTNASFSNVTYNLEYDFAHTSLASESRLKYFFKDPGNKDGTSVDNVSSTTYGNLSEYAKVNYKSDYADYSYDEFATILSK